MNTRPIYRMLAILNDLSALASGNPRRITRRVKNRIVGRTLGRMGFWRWLWH